MYLLIKNNKVIEEFESLDNNFIKVHLINKFGPKDQDQRNELFKRSLDYVLGLYQVSIYKKLK